MIRRVLAIAIVVACAACGAVVGPDLSTSPLALFDRVWSDFDLHYSLFIVKGVNWDSLRAVYRPMAAQATNQFGAQNAIIRLLSNLHDGHVLFRGASTGTTAHGSIDAPTITYGRYVTPRADFSGGVSCGTIATTIGYIEISTFDGTQLLPEIDSALSALNGVQSIIIDVRNNDGGLVDNAIGAASRFAQRRVTVAYVKYRNGPAHTDFTDFLEQQVQPAGPSQFAGPVYLLTSRNTVSAAELFTLSMYALGRTTVVGDTTAGETGSPCARELQNGWTYQLPESIEYTLAGASFEDIGIPPDVPQQNTNRQLAANIDAQLERAIALASQP
jgi:hypothetical protein